MINFFGPVNGLGVGIHNYNLAKAFTDLGNDVCLVPPFGRVEFENEYVSAWLKNRGKFSSNDPSVMIFDPVFLTQFSGTPRIGFAVFETDGFTEIQLAAMKSCDFLLTPSSWGKKVLGDHGLKSDVVNEGIDPDAFPIQTPRETGVFRFVSVGKLEERKGTLQLARCFFKALEREDAELVLHCQNPFMQDGGLGEISRALTGVGFKHDLDRKIFTRAGLRVKFAGRINEMSDAYYTADCGVFPSKGEGWGLPIHECVASGVPAIAGVWTGQSEYLGADYPYQLSFERSRMEMAWDGTWFHGDRGGWHAVADEDLIAKIQWAFENARRFRKSAEWSAAVGRAREFTWERAARQLEAFVAPLK